MPNPLTPHTVAARCGVSVSTVQRWLRDGTLRGVKLGPRMWTVPEAALAEFTPPARGPKPRDGQPRLAERAAEMVVDDPALLNTVFFDCATDRYFIGAYVDLARRADTNNERARAALATAIRRARNLHK